MNYDYGFSLNFISEEKAKEIFGIAGLFLNEYSNATIDSYNNIVTMFTNGDDYSYILSEENETYLSIVRNENEINKLKKYVDRYFSLICNEEEIIILTNNFVYFRKFRDIFDIKDYKNLKENLKVTILNIILILPEDIKNELKFAMNKNKTNKEKYNYFIKKYDKIDIDLDDNSADIFYDILMNN